MGIGVCQNKRVAWVTKNGRFLGVVATELQGRVHPAVGMSTEGRVRVNFGKEEWVCKDWRAIGERLEVRTVEVPGAVLRGDEEAEYAKWG